MSRSTRLAPSLLFTLVAAACGGNVILDGGSSPGNGGAGTGGAVLTTGTAMTCLGDGVACSDGSQCCSLLCQGGACQPGGVMCATDSDCPLGTACDMGSGSCVSGPTCLTDADCPSNDICDTATDPGICVSGASGGGGTCGSTGNACTSDADCCSFLCIPDTGTCQ